MANKNSQELGKKVTDAKKPRGKWVTAIAYELGNVEKFKAFGSVIVRGCPPAGIVVGQEWVSSKVREHGVGLRNESEFVFVELSVSSMRV